jgi:putative phosphoribosyl transferase
VTFTDRVEAGMLLARRLADERIGGSAHDPVVVLGIPRGGVLVAAPVARRLGGILDVIVPRKIGAPEQRELAVGALALAGEEPIALYDSETVRQLRVPRSYLEEEEAAQIREIRRRRHLYRGDRPLPPLEKRNVVIVDDGLATGLTARAAAAAVRRLSPASLIVAVPVAPAETVETFRDEGLRLLALATPAPFFAVGRFYDDFHDVSDAEVLETLASVPPPARP